MSDAPQSWAGFVVLVLGLLMFLLVAPFWFAFNAAREAWYADVLPAWQELRNRTTGRAPR